MIKGNVCLWCHRAGSELLESTDCDGEQVVVHPSHRVQLDDYCRQTSFAKWRLLGGIGASILLSIVATLLLMLHSDPVGSVTMGVATAVCGLTLLRYPFATPETLLLFGARRSIMAVRAAACFILAIAVAITAYGVTA